MSPTISSLSLQVDYYYRPVRPGDREEIKRLHEEWFPVRYQDEFYDDLVKGIGPSFGRTSNKDTSNNDTATQNGQAAQSHHKTASNDTESDRTLFSCVAIRRKRSRHVSMRPLLDYGDDDQTCQDGKTNGSMVRDVEQQASSIECGSSSHDGHPNDDEIMACVVGTFLEAHQLSQHQQELLISDELRYRRVFYIMTLGTSRQYRKTGLGSAMVQQCIQQVQADPSCGVLYLHVITFNQGAIRLYEKLGFYRVEEIVNYYVIDGKHYNCYLYAKYFHGKDESRPCTLCWIGRSLLCFFSNSVSSHRFCFSLLIRLYPKAIEAIVTYWTRSRKPLCTI